MFVGLFIGVFGTLFGIWLYGRYNTFVIKHRWQTAGEQWADLLNRIEGTVQYYRHRGPDPELVMELRADLDAMEDMHIPKHELAEHQERIEKLERSRRAVEEWGHQL